LTQLRDASHMFFVPLYHSPDYHKMQSKDSFVFWWNASRIDIPKL
jgi:hypothetical protein